MRLGSMLSHMYAPVVAQRLRLVLVLALAGAVALPLFAGSVQQVSMRAQDWRVWGWGGFKQVYSLSSQATGLYFTFPEGNTSAVNYMYQPRKAPIAGSALSLTYQIVSTGTPTWNYFFPQFDPGNLCVTPATTRFWFASANLSVVVRPGRSPVDEQLHGHAHRTARSRSMDEHLRQVRQSGRVHVHRLVELAAESGTDGPILWRRLLSRPRGEHPEWLREIHLVGLFDCALAKSGRRKNPAVIKAGFRNPQSEFS